MNIFTSCPIVTDLIFLKKLLERGRGAVTTDVVTIVNIVVIKGLTMSLFIISLKRSKTWDIAGKYLARKAIKSDNRKKYCLGAQCIVIKSLNSQYSRKSR